MAIQTDLSIVPLGWVYVNGGMLDFRGSCHVHLFQRFDAELAKGSSKIFVYNYARSMSEI